MENWDDFREQLPRSVVIRHADLEKLEKALERQRLFIGLLGMLGGLDNELWTPGPVGRDEHGKLQAGGDAEMLAMVFWWMRELAAQYLKIADSQTCQDTDDWKAMWMTSWDLIAGGMLSVGLIVVDGQLPHELIPMCYRRSRH